MKTITSMKAKILSLTLLSTLAIMNAEGTEELKDKGASATRARMSSFAQKRAQAEKERLLSQSVELPETTTSTSSSLQKKVSTPKKEEVTTAKTVRRDVASAKKAEEEEIILPSKKKAGSVAKPAPRIPALAKKGEKEVAKEVATVKTAAAPTKYDSLLVELEEKKQPAKSKKVVSGKLEKETASTREATLLAELAKTKEEAEAYKLQLTENTENTEKADKVIKLLKEKLNAALSEKDAALSEKEELVGKFELYSQLINAAVKKVIVPFADEMDMERPESLKVTAELHGFFDLVAEKMNHFTVVKAEGEEEAEGEEGVKLIATEEEVEVIIEEEGEGEAGDEDVVVDYEGEAVEEEAEDKKDKDKEEVKIEGEDNA